MVADGNPYKYAALAARKTKNRYNQRSDDSMRIAGPFRPAGHQKKSDRMAETHPAAIQFGVPRSEPRSGQAGGDGASEHVYNFAARNRQYCETTRNAEIIRNNKTSGNSRKPLGMLKRLYPLSFHILVGPFRAEAVVAGQLLVAKQDGRDVVGGQQTVQIAVAIEVAVSQPAADTGLVEASARFGGHVAEFSVPFV